MIFLSTIKTLYVLTILWLVYIHYTTRYLWEHQAIAWIPLLTDSDGSPFNSSVPVLFGPCTMRFSNKPPPSLDELKVSVFDGNACQEDIPQLTGLVLFTVTNSCSKGDQVLNLQEHGAEAVVFEHLESDPAHLVLDMKNDKSIKVPAIILDSVGFDHLKHSENASIKFKNLKMPTDLLLYLLGVGVLCKAITWGNMNWARRNPKEIKEKDLV